MMGVRILHSLQQAAGFPVPEKKNSREVVFLLDDANGGLQPVVSVAR